MALQPLFIRGWKQLSAYSDLVYEGKLVHESSYPQRTSKYEEVEIDGIKVDYYDAKNKVIRG